MGAEFLKFNEDGTVEVSLVEKNVTLRRPKAKEYIALRELLEEFEDKSTPVTNDLNRVIVQSREFNTNETRFSDEALAIADEIRKLSREIRDMGERTRVEFFTAVLRTLDKKKAEPNEDDFPAEIYGDWISDLVEHWRTRPTDPGAS